MSNLAVEQAVFLINKKLGLKIKEWKPLSGGMNNKLFCLNALNKKLLLKLYVSDDRNRLQREYSSFEYLKKEGFVDVPLTFLKDKKLNFAVYSFEEGIPKNAEDLNKKDLEKMVDFLVRLQKLKPPTSQFLPAVMSCFSLEEYLKKIENRVENFSKAINDPELQVGVKNFVQKTKILNFLKEKSLMVCQNIRKNKLTEVINEKDKRLSPVDFGIHNTIFKLDGNQVYVDFEYFGWDDPTEVIAFFVNHDKTTNLSDENKKFFIETYKNKSRLPKHLIDKLDSLIVLDSLDWIGLLLGSMTPVRIKYYINSNQNIDPLRFTREQIVKIEKRLNDLS